MAKNFVEVREKFPLLASAIATSLFFVCFLFESLLKFLYFVYDVGNIVTRKAFFVQMRLWKTKDHLMMILI